MTLQLYLRPLPLIAVLRGITPAEIDAVGAALIDNGFRILEVPLDSPQPFDSLSRVARGVAEGDADLSGRRYSPRQYDGVLGSRRQRIWHRLEPVRPGGHGRCRA